MLKHLQCDCAWRRNSKKFRFVFGQDKYLTRSIIIAYIIYVLVCNIIKIHCSKKKTYKEKEAKAFSFHSCVCLITNTEHELECCAIFFQFKLLFFFNVHLCQRADAVAIDQALRVSEIYQGMQDYF